MNKIPFTTFIHIGHGKTGTSATQSALALIRKKLRALGIIYPIQEEIAAKAEQLEITSGNWPANPSESVADFFLEAYKKYHNESTSCLVFSSENLFWKINELSELSDQELFKINPHVILVVRDVEEMLSSEYLQMVKRHGESRSFAEYLKARDYKSGHHRVSNSIIKTLNRRPIKLSVFNYSKNRQSITRLIFDKIGASSIEVPKNLSQKAVNRSLTTFELKAVIAINSLYGEILGRKVADQLVEYLPEAVADSCKYTEEEKKLIYEINHSSIIGINNALEKSQHLYTSPKQPKLLKNSSKTQEAYESSKLSSDIIRKAISEHTQNAYIRENTPSLSSLTIKKLRKISKREKLNPSIRQDIEKIIEFFGKPG